MNEQLKALIYQAEEQLMRQDLASLELSLSQIEQIAADNPYLFYFKGMAQLIQKNDIAALEQFYGAYQASPSEPIFANNIGNILLNNKLPRLALYYFEQAIQAAPEFELSRFNKACALQQSRSMRPAIDIFKTFEQSAEFKQEAVANMGNCYQFLRDFDSAEAAYQELLSSSPTATVYNNLARNYYLQDNKKQAIDNYIKGINSDKGFSGNYIGLADIYRQEERYQEAIQVVNMALKQKTSEDLLYFMSTLLALNEQTKESYQLCNQILAAKPNNMKTKALKGVLAHKLNEKKVYQEIYNYNKHLKAYDLLPNLGNTALHVNTELVQSIRNDESLVSEPAGKATRMGHQTGDMLLQKTRSVSWLSKVIQQQCELYNKATNQRQYKQEDCFVALQGVELFTSGHQLAHNHPSAQLSGVSYWKLPEEKAEEGWLEVGRLPEELEKISTIDVVKIKPEVGKLVIFPSYYYHNTIPFHETSSRVSIAFDAAYSPLPQALRNEAES